MIDYIGPRIGRVMTFGSYVGAHSFVCFVSSRRLIIQLISLFIINIIPMARTNTYLNFRHETEEAFNFYRSVFGGEFVGGINRFSDIPPHEGVPEIAEEDKHLVMHIALPILGGHMLMGTDAPESMGLKVIMGNNVHISLEPDTRKDTERLFAALSEEGKVTMPLQDMFWGDYYGSCTDKFGVHWMVNCPGQKK